MEIHKNIIKLLNKPFPEEESWLDNFKTSTLFSAFLFYFLYVFEPFGLNELGADKFKVIFGFGMMTLIGLLFYEFLIRQVFKWKGGQVKWTYGKWILYNLGLLFFLSLANFLFIRLVFFGYIDWRLYHHMLYSHLTIGIFPIILIGRLALMRQEKKFQSIAQEINQQKETPIANNPTNDNDILTICDIPVHQIKYIEALQNYATIGFLNADGQLTKQTERLTLKSILEKTKGSTIKRSHRSFLVNQEAIIATSGNAQGLLLTLSECDKEIPVSRTYVPAFRNIKE